MIPGRVGSVLWMDIKSKKYYYAKNTHGCGWTDEMNKSHFTSFDKLSHLENEYIPRFFTSTRDIFYTQRVENIVDEEFLKQLKDNRQFDNFAERVSKYGLNGLKQFYENGVIVNDIKSRNFVVTKDGKVIFFDFDDAHVFDQEAQATDDDVKYRNDLYLKDQNEFEKALAEYLTKDYQLHDLECNFS